MVQKTFLKLFPPPKFLNMSYAGLDITDDAIRAIQFAHGSHGLVISKYHTEKLPSGFIEAGFIKDEAGVTKVLRSLVNKLGLSFVRVSLPEEKMYLFKSEVPSLNQKEIRQSVEFRLEENVPLSPANATFYYDILSDAALPVGKHTAMISVAPRKVIDIYLGVLESAGLTVMSLELQARSLARAFVSKGIHGTQLIVNILDQKTGLYIVHDGVVLFTSTAGWGGLMLGKDGDSSASHATDILQKEIGKIYSYWSEHGEGMKAIDQIILSGKYAQHVGLLSHISPDPKVPVQIGNPWTNVFSNEQYIPPIAYEDSLDYAAAIGLALPQ